MVAIVQAASSTGGSSVTVTLGSPTTAANCLVACIAMGSSGSTAHVSSVTLGGVGDNWAQLKAAGDLATGAEQLATWADPNCAGGQTAVAVTVTPALVTLAQVFEASGIAASSVLDQSGTFDSGGSSSGPAFSVSTGGTTTQAPELAVGCAYGYNQTVTGPSSPWVNESTVTSTTRTLQAGYQVLSSAGTVTYSGSLGGSTFNGQVLVTLKPSTGPPPPAAPPPPVIPPHPLFTRVVLEQAWQRADWQAEGVADLAVAFSSSSGGVDTYNVLSPWNGGTTQPMRVLAPTAPNPSYPHAFLLMLPVQPGQDTSPYGDSIGTAQAIAAHNGYNLTCVQPGYAGIGGADEGPWLADNPLNPAISQEKFTLLVTAWIRQHLAVTGTEQVYLIGFSRTGNGGQNLLFRHPYTYAACASWDGAFGMTDYDGTDPVRGTPAGGDPQDGFGTSVNFTTNYQLTAARLGACQATGQYGTNRIWIGQGPAFGPDFTWYDGLLTSAGIPHAAAFSNTVESHAWQTDWVAAALASIIPSDYAQAATVLPQQVPRPLLTQLLAVAAWRTPVSAPPPATAVAGSAALSGSGSLTAVLVLPESAVLSGAGSLSVSGALSPAAGLSGSGTLTAAPQLAGGAAFTGTGSFVAGSALAQSAGLSGSGSLLASGLFSGEATLSGQGSFSAASSLAGAASMAGAGTLTAGGQLAGAAGLSGAGSLTAAAGLSGAVTFSGQGAFTVTGQFAAAVTLSGAGSLVLQVSLAAALSGTGTLTASYGGFADSSVMSGAGTLSAGPQFPDGAALSGAGALTAGPVLSAAALLAGAGALTVTPGFAAAAALSGVGSLTAQWTTAVAAATLTGDGTLTAAAVLVVAVAVSLSGTGTLSARGTSLTGIAGSCLAADWLAFFTLAADWPVYFAGADD